MKPMKNWILCFCLGICGQVLAQTGNATGYEIRVSLNAYQNQYLYLAYHYGKTKALADSAQVQANGTAVFKGTKPLPGGIYIMVSPKKEFYFHHRKRRFVFHLKIKYGLMSLYDLLLRR